MVLANFTQYEERHSGGPSTLYIVIVILILVSVTIISIFDIVGVWIGTFRDSPIEYVDGKTFGIDVVGRALALYLFIDLNVLFDAWNDNHRGRLLPVFVISTAYILATFALSRYTRKRLERLAKKKELSRPNTYDFYGPQSQRPRIRSLDEV